ncbi:MAG: hypothetical protein Tsb008_18060 [Rhodothalassiaceae bacterium]
MPSDMADLEDDGLTEAQRLQLVEVLFQIMKSFVLMGYGMEPVNKLIEDFQNCANAEANLLEFEDDDESNGHD